MDGARDAVARRGAPGVCGVLLLGILLASVLILAAPAARAAPPRPMVVYGHAYDDAGNPLPAGTPIRVFLDGVQYSNDSVVLDASGAYSVAVAGNWMINATTPETPNLKEGPNRGESVQFSAGDFTGPTAVFQETIPWGPGANASLDLHLAPASSVPSPLKIQGIVTQPAAGGAQYVLLCNPGLSAAALPDYYLETDVRGSYFGPNVTLAGSLGAGAILRENITITGFLAPAGDALKLVYRNPGGTGAPAGGRDIVVDRLEYNATANGTLDWEPGNTIMGSAPAPNAGFVLQRSPFCGDTNAPSDFHLGFQPGVAPNTQPTVRITAPRDAQTLSGDQTFTFAWTMADPAFLSAYLRAWVNVTCQGTTAHLLAGVAGTTSVDWSVPNVAAAGCVVEVDVQNPYGGQGTATATFAVQPSPPWILILAILIAAVLVAFLLLAWRRKRRRAKEAPKPPAAASPEPPPAPAAQASSAPSPSTKVCPNCHTVVRAEDTSCFFCGQPLPPP